MKRIVGWVGLLMVLGCLAPGVHATSSPKVTVQLIITNAQGSVVAKMTPDGVPTYSADYRPYGTTQSTPQAGPGYTGHVMDPTSGLVYMQQRYYDPATGRFISPDPVAPTPGNIFNFGRYTYADDNPVRYTDPDGRCATYGKAKALCRQQKRRAKENKRVVASGGSVWVSAQQRKQLTVYFRPKVQAASAGAVAVTGTLGAAEGETWLSAIGAKLFGVIGVTLSLGGATQQEDTPPSGKVVIGEGMRERVIPYANSIGAEHYIPRDDLTPDQYMDANRVWINVIMDEKYTIINIGPMPGRANYPLPTSPFYKMELEQIHSRAYPVINVKVP